MDEIGTVLGKMELDCWPNLVVLKNGEWFVSSEIERSYFKFGVHWIEFRIYDASYNIETQDKRPGVFEIDGALSRGMAVNAQEILYIKEFDG